MNLSESPWQELIQLYAAHPFRTVGTLPEYARLENQYEGKSVFGTAKSRIETAAIHIQNRMSKALDSAQQTAAALELLKRTRAKREEMEIFYELLTKGYRSNLSPAQQSYLKEGFQALSVSHDFFFSFSTRRELPDGEHPINIDYRHIILRVLTPAEWESADRRRENLLAKAVYTLMAEKKGHRGFYFPDSQYDNTYTQEKLETQLRDSYVFVQMVQNVMFRPPDKGDNYCHFEFTQAFDRLQTREQQEHRMLFLIAERKENFVREWDVYVGYQSWFDAIKSKDVPYLPDVPVPGNADARYLEINTLIEDKLVGSIDAAWDRLIDNVPQ